MNELRNITNCTYWCSLSRDNHKNSPDEKDRLKRCIFNIRLFYSSLRLFFKKLSSQPSHQHDVLNFRNSTHTALAESAVWGHYYGYKLIFLESIVSNAFVLICSSLYKWFKYTYDQRLKAGSSGNGITSIAYDLSTKGT